jgi:hypothetical protein
VLLARRPITGIAGCCACVASGQATAPPTPAMNSRRRIRHAPDLIYGQPIAAWSRWERAENEDRVTAVGHFGIDRRRTGLSVSTVNPALM